MAFKWLAQAASTIGLALFVIACPAGAETWPDRPITVMVPSPPGGSTDATARVIAQQLANRLKVSVIVDNKAGAQGGIGLGFLAKAKPDGYTIGIATSSHLTLNPNVFKTLPYDPEKDFAPIALTSVIPNVIVVKDDLPVNTLPEFIDWVRQNPGKVAYGSGGYGSTHHVATEQLKKMAGIQILHVPYQGGAPAMVALLGGQVQMLAAPLVEAQPFLAAKKIKPLAVTTSKRWAGLPDVPTVAETLPGFEVLLWNGFLAPAGTPDAIVERLNHEINAILKSEEVRHELISQGAMPTGGTPAEFRRYLKSQIEVSRTMMKSLDIHAE